VVLECLTPVFPTCSTVEFDPYIKWTGDPASKVWHPTVIDRPEMIKSLRRSWEVVDVDGCLKALYMPGEQIPRRVEAAFAGLDQSGFSVSSDHSSDSDF